MTEVSNAREPRILIYDIETSPHVGYIWGKWEQNVIKFIEYGHILCFSYKWLGDKKIKNVSMPDFALYKKDKKDDKEVVKALHALFTEADIVVAHNGNNFDQKYANSRLILHKLAPPEEYKQIDTLQLARKYAKFPSNSLNDLCDYLGIGHKAETGGFKTWEGCMEGDPKAWKTMINYNNYDVDLLEKIYLKLRPWAANHPALNVINGLAESCPKCGVGGQMQKRGKSINKVSTTQRYQCQSCSGWSRGRIIEKTPVLYVN